MPETMPEGDAVEENEFENDLGGYITNLNQRRRRVVGYLAMSSKQRSVLPKLLPNKDYTGDELCAFRSVEAALNHREATES